MNRALIIIFSFLFALLLLLLLVLFLPQVLSGNTARAPGDGEILVEFLDVGQADCALVRTKDVTVLIDTGAPETANRVIKHLKSAGIERIDCLVLSHAHSDHIGGAALVLSSFAVGACLMPNDAPNTEEFRSLLASLRREDCRVLEAYRGITLTFGEIFLEVLSPGIYTPLGENAKSQALRLTYRGNSFLFMGDCGIPEEGEILSHYSASDLSSQVLKVGHHGSRDGTGEAFLSAVCPEIAVISCGSGNSYGFPGAELLVRLSAAGCRILRTDTGGTHALLGNGRDVTALK